MTRSIRLTATLVAVLLGSVDISGAAAGITADLEDVSLPPNSYLNGGPNTSTNVFNSHGVLFPNSYDATFDVWDGWAISNKTDVMTSGFGNQYSAYNLSSGGGVGGSPNFAIGFPSFSTGLTVQLPVGYNPSSVQLTNTTYAALSMRDGDTFAKKFGGQSGNDPDYFYVTIRGIDGNQQPVGSVNFYLADYHFADNSQDYIVSHWTPVDLSSLAGAKTLSFDFASSDVGMFGINTPTYVALDDLQLLDVPTRKGDLNLDGATSITDVSALMAALSDLQKYQAAHNLTDDETLALGNLDEDHKVTNLDLQALVNILANAGGGGTLTPVPEPAPGCLAVIGATVLLISWRPRRLICATLGSPAAAQRL
jgi:hypothetical protein